MSQPELNLESKPKAEEVCTHCNKPGVNAFIGPADDMKPYHLECHMKVFPHLYRSAIERAAAVADEAFACADI